MVGIGPILYGRYWGNTNFLSSIQECPLASSFVPVNSDFFLWKKRHVIQLTMRWMKGQRVDKQAHRDLLTS